MEEEDIQLLLTPANTLPQRQMQRVLARNSHNEGSNGEEKEEQNEETAETRPRFSLQQGSSHWRER